MKTINDYRTVLSPEWRRKDLAEAMAKLEGWDDEEIYFHGRVDKTIRAWKRKGIIEQTPRGMTFWWFV